MLAHQHGDGIHFLAGRTAGHPDAHRIGGTAALEEFRHHLLRQFREGFLVAEKTGDVDEQIAKQRAGLLRIRSQMLDIGFRLCKLIDLHAAATHGAETSWLCNR